MTTLFLVWGQTGEYADRTEWVVCAHDTEEGAKRHVAAAQARADELYSDFSGYQEIPLGANEYDAGMRTDYTGVTYCCGPVDLMLDKPAQSRQS